MRRIFRGGTNGLRGSGARQLSPACGSLTLSAGGVISQARWSGLALHGRTSEAQGWLQFKRLTCIVAKGFPKCVDLGLHLDSSGRSAMLKHAHVSCEECASSRVQIWIWRSDCGLGVVKHNHCSRMYAHIQMANKALISALKKCLQLRTMMHNKNKMVDRRPRDSLCASQMASSSASDRCLRYVE
ncbi:hypothetical protein KC349_g111 [Hortaea werneckii]|nr:hypothetical protein KC349_g111 [Hortaea werneckii]